MCYDLSECQFFNIWFHFNIYSITIQIHNVNKISSSELDIWACDFSLGKFIPSRNRCPYFEDAQECLLL